MSRVSTNVSQTPRSRRSTLVAITAAIIGIIYGYDLGNISGALLTRGRPLEAIRLYWENGAKWPDERKAA